MAIYIQGSNGQQIKVAGAGTDATINGVPALTVAATGGLTGQMQGSTFTISGQSLQDQLNNIIVGNAGSHNCFYRGANLGTSVTPAQYAAIEAGTFDDLFIGDYWTIGGFNWRIAAFDYYIGCGDTYKVIDHHAVIVPDTTLYNAQMINTSSEDYEPGLNTNSTGYIGSDMYKANLDPAKNQISPIFSGHILTVQNYFVNSVIEGIPASGAWVDSTVDLMDEQMVYGGPIYMTMSNGNNLDNHRLEKGPLPLFFYRHDLITTKDIYWLRDTASNKSYCAVSYNGRAHCLESTYSVGVRPYFCIK